MKYTTLTLETPENCEECPFQTAIGTLRMTSIKCKVAGETILTTSERIGSCPFKRRERKEMARRMSAVELALKRDPGILIKLPCEIGDAVYRINTESGTIIEDTIMQITICDGFILLHGHIIDEMDAAEVGKTVFFSKEEARRRLEEIRNDL